ncbi:peptidase M28 family protein [Pelomyxa schiedti]|nr:peptidase M28 family protein [Pelomyxa schiedti]
MVPCRVLLNVALFLACVIGVMSDDVDLLLDAIVSDTEQFDRIYEMCDTFGSRLTGSQDLEDSFDWCQQLMTADGLEYSPEKVPAPHWIHNHHGDELLLLSPGKQRYLSVTCLGDSIGTGSSPVTAQVLVVSSFDELQARADEAVGKIVVYDIPFTTYGASSPYRINGAVEAAKVGAIASLTNSITQLSLYTLHTGVMYYEEGVTVIPAGSITVEDAQMLHRMQNRSQTPTLQLTLDCSRAGFTSSRNLITEVKGSLYPDELVIISGHLDSWDVGSTLGAQDDASGAFAGWQIVRLMTQLGLKAKRTIRAVLWTCEEFGGCGGRSYTGEHVEEMNNTSIALEMDNNGAYIPSVLTTDLTQEGLEMFQPILDRLAKIVNVTAEYGGGGEDIDHMQQYGVPVLGLSTKPDVNVNLYANYFDVHHSPADTADKLVKSQWDLCVSTFAVISYMVADLDSLLPRTNSPVP